MWKPSSRQQRGRSCTQPSIQWVLQRQTTAAASSESSQKSNVRSRNGDKPQRPETGRQQPQRPTQGKPNNQNNFPYRDYRYSDQLRQTRFNKKQNRMYSPYHFAPSPCTLCRLPTYLVILSCSLQKQSHSLEIFAAQQKSQIDVYQELTRSNKEKEHDALFTSIPVFDGRSYPV